MMLIFFFLAGDWTHGLGKHSTAWVKSPVLSLLIYFSDKVSTDLCPSSLRTVILQLLQYLGFQMHTTIPGLMLDF
jgi:hypothetical protein